ncbi:ketosteroid isomerase [Planomonospora parontospora subsp. parontospora]|uniref:Ketosteroid isomerase n=2 Tax=Planomonospora parontospora TaxID=58119 RepID=A0AA37BG18_9ACTN|nr:nuclear transport factor 2 family protein [Planomonospora parontospora]GGK65957.1 ketosteroid isomerase [Planomonospora parontospora]GII08425.1 ketosteroid isomerase [Planomonospora parontospora subsp. parontospora]
MDTTRPAVAAALTAMGAVGAGDRDAWLACYAPEAVLHDPVGGSPLDPDGTGLRGTAALERFWELTVAANEVRFEIAAVHPAGDEAAVVASVSVRFPTGGSAAYDGVFVYRTGGDGRIVSLRAYWDLQAVLSALGA